MDKGGLGRRQGPARRARQDWGRVRARGPQGDSRRHHWYAAQGNPYTGETRRAYDGKGALPRYFEALGRRKIAGVRQRHADRRKHGRRLEEPLSHDQGVVLDRDIRRLRDQRESNGSGQKEAMSDRKKFEP